MKNNFDFQKAVEAKQEGMDRAERSAGSNWMNEAFELGVEIAKQQPTVSADDLWRAGLSDPPEPRALGPVFARLRAADVLEATGEFIKTERVSRHNAPIAVWRSLIYQSPSGTEVP